MKKALLTVIFNKDNTPAEIIKIAAHYGMQGIEWRVSPDYHLHWTQSDTVINELLKQMAEHGLVIPALASYIETNDIENIKSLFAFAARLKVSQVRVLPEKYNLEVKESYPVLFDKTKKDLGKVLEVSRSYGIKTLLEIHPGRINPSPSASYRLVEGFDPRDVGVIFDPGNMVLEGMENLRMAVELLGPYLAHVHVKNLGWAKEGTKWQWQYLPTLDGIADWQVTLKILEQSGYSGWYSLEDFSSRPIELKMEEFVRL